MSKKIDRALYGPSWTEVIFGALLSILLGGVLAAAYLITKPVTTVKEIPKEPVAGMVYHIEGSKDGTKGRSWVAKRQQLVAGLSVMVSEEELNTAVTAAAPPVPKKAGAKEEPAAETKPGAFTPGAPNFRIRDQELQIAVPVTINTFDLGLNILVQARGDFEKQGEQFVFTPKSLLVGSCPVGKIPGMTNIIMHKFVGAHKVPEDIAGAWAKLASVSIDGAKLKLDAP